MKAGRAAVALIAGLAVATPAGAEDCLALARKYGRAILDNCPGAEQQQAAADRAARQRARRKAEAQAAAARKAARAAAAARARQLAKPDARIGMTIDQVIADTRWGYPNDAHRVRTANGTTVTLIYAGRGTLTFVNNKLEVISE